MLCLFTLDSFGRSDLVRESFLKFDDIGNVVDVVEHRGKILANCLIVHMLSLRFQILTSVNVLHLGLFASAARAKGEARPLIKVGREGTANWSGIDPIAKCDPRGRATALGIVDGGVIGGCGHITGPGWWPEPRA